MHFKSVKHLNKMKKKWRESKALNQTKKAFLNMKYIKIRTMY